MNTKVTILCDVHGEFSQRPADHINGSGCPECSLLGRGQYSLQYFESFPEEKEVSAVVYLVNVDDKFCKVGISKRTVARRFGNKQVRPVALVDTTLENAYEYEQQILEKFSSYRFRSVGLTSRQFSGWTECFPISLIPELTAEFAGINGVEIYA
jgi:hypothetical protein